MTPDRHQHALKPGDKLHWYEIQSILGHGGFGITYLARDTNHADRFNDLKKRIRTWGIRTRDPVAQTIGAE